MQRIKRLFRRVLITIFILLLLVVLVLVVTDNTYVFRAVKLIYMKGETTANIDDYVDFDNRKISSHKHIPWEKSLHYGKVELTPKLQNALNTDHTISFAIIKEGKLIYDNYWQGYTKDSHTNSFSMAKSITTMLYLKAVEDGYISSVNAPISELLPEYKDNQFAKLCTLADLSAMTSGYDWLEDYYFLINPTAKAYYGNNLEEQILSRDFIKPCGTFQYSSGDTQLLGIALKRALEPHGLTISSYLEQSFWQPLGMKNEAYWSLDGSKDIEKTYCCISASTLDFAKFGQLLLNGGEWHGKQLLSKKHIDFMITPNKEAFSKNHPVIYGHSIWTDMDTPIPFYALIGHLGQRVLVLPEENTIIVRLGTQSGEFPQTQGYHIDTDLGLYVTEVKKVLDGLE